jgi:hypothetical protein
LGRADAFIVVVSAASRNKPWVRDELDAATVQRINRGARLITTILDGEEAPEPVKHLLWINGTRTAAGAADVAQQIADVLHGHDRKPPLGPVPAYTTAPAFPGLTAHDAVVLVETTRQALESGLTIALQWAPVVDRASAQGVNQQAALESLEALGQQHLVEADVRGTRVVSLALTEHGYRTAISSLVENHDEIEQRIIASLVNEAPRSDMVIKTLAADLDASELVEAQVLKDLHDQDLISFARYLGEGSRVHGVSSTLRRLLR